MNANPLEKQIEKRVCDFAKSLGVLTYKFNSMSRRDVPDRLLIPPGGVTFYIEFKRLGEKPTRSQEIEIAKIRKQGAKVFVVDNVLDGRNVVSAMVDAMRNSSPLGDPMF